MANRKVRSLLICNSNMFIPTVLTEVLSHTQERYLIISDTANIHLFFHFMDLPNVDYLEYGIKGRFDFIREKKRLYNAVKQYDIGQVIFFHTEYGEMANWLIKRLSKTIPIRYCKIYDPIPVPHCKSVIKVLKVKLRQWLYWRVDMEVLEHSYVFPSLPKKFFSIVCATTITMPVNPALVSKSVYAKLTDSNLSARYVLLTGTCVAMGMADADTYEGLINRVIEILGLDNTVSKCHPRFKYMYGLEKELRQIPSYIPGNVIIDNFHCYVGFESTLLVEAALSGKKSISLIYFLPLSPEAKQRRCDMFTSRLQGKAHILYPKSFDELKVMLE